MKRLLRHVLLIAILFLCMPQLELVVHGETIASDGQNAVHYPMWIGDQEISVYANMEPKYLLTKNNHQEPDFGAVFSEGASAENYHIKVEADANVNVTITLRGASIMTMNESNRYGISGPGGKHVTLISDTNEENWVRGNEIGIFTDGLTLKTKRLTVIGYGGDGIRTNGDVVISEDDYLSNVNAYDGDGIRADEDIIIEGTLGEVHGTGMSGYGLNASGDVVISGTVNRTIGSERRSAIGAGGDIIISGSANELKGSGAGINSSGAVNISGTVAKIETDGTGIYANESITISGEITDGIATSGNAMQAESKIDIQESAVIKSIVGNSHGLYCENGDIILAGNITNGISSENVGVRAKQGTVFFKAPLSISAEECVVSDNDIVLEGVYISLPENGFISKLNKSYCIVDAGNEVATNVVLANDDGTHITEWQITIGGTVVSTSAVRPAYLLLDGNGGVTEEGATSDNYQIRYTVDQSGNATVLLNNVSLNTAKDYGIYLNREKKLTVIGRGNSRISGGVVGVVSKGDVVIEGTFAEITGGNIGIEAGTGIMGSLTLDGKVDSITGGLFGVVARKDITITENAEIGMIESTGKKTGNISRMALWAVESITILSPVEVCGVDGALGFKELSFGNELWYKWKNDENGEMINSSEKDYLSTFPESYSDKYLKVEYVDVTVTYDKGAGTGNMEKMETNSKRFPLPESQFTPPAGYQFKAWSVEGTEYQPGDQVRFCEDVTVTALYEKIPAQLGDITVSEDVTISYGQSAAVSVTVDEDTDLYDYTYQWCVTEASGTDTEPKLIEGASDHTYTIPSNQAAGSYQYFCRVLATRKDNGDTVAKDSAVITITINKVDQTPLQIIDVLEKIVQGDTFVLKATGGADECALIWKITSGADIASIDQNTGEVTVTGYGDFTVQAIRSGNEKYNEISQSLTLTAQKKAIAGDEDNEDYEEENDEESKNESVDTADHSLLYLWIVTEFIALAIIIAYCFAWKRKRSNY